MKHRLKRVTINKERIQGRGPRALTLKPHPYVEPFKILCFGLESDPPPPSPTNSFSAGDPPLWIIFNLHCWFGKSHNSRKKGQISIFFQNPDIQIKPGESTVHEVSFQWLHFRTSFTDSKLRTTVHSIINSTTEKIQLGSFHLNDPTLEFHLQTQKVRTTLHGITNGTTSYHKKVLLTSFHLNGGSHCLISST